MKSNRLFQLIKGNVHKDTDWSYAADLWCAWISKDSETWDDFVANYDEENEADFFGYSSDFEGFADDWVSPPDRESYLDFCRKNQ
jgi:hypothetical protein